MYQLFTILIVLAAIVLIFLVMIQNSKGGGLAAGFSSSNQVMGVRKTTDFLEKATWSFAGSMVVLCIFVALFVSRPGVRDSIIRDDIQNFTPAPAFNFPDFSIPFPEGEGDADPAQ
jgi:preprotein translocase subunit SecG